jgi:hypothetical protein
MQKIGTTLFVLALLILSGCTTAKPASPMQVQAVPQVIQQEETPKNNANQTAEAEDTMIVAEFDTVKITKQTFNKTKSDIQVVVDDLNRITYAKDYQRWLSYLSEEYIKEFSDPANLEKVSSSLPTKGIKLKNLKDYFNYVFVPSRQNMRVDDIKFVSPTRVYVIMELSPKNPAAIYILEKTDHGWKLVLKNQ